MANSCHYATAWSVGIVILFLTRSSCLLVLYRVYKRGNLGMCVCINTYIYIGIGIGVAPGVRAPPPMFYKLLYKLLTTLCVVSDCVPPIKKSLLRL